jgi:hypothetical protein
MRTDGQTHMTKLVDVLRPKEEDNGKYGLINLKRYSKLAYS